MNPTPTPNSTAPVNIARLRELLAKATPAPWYAVMSNHRIRIHGDCYGQPSGIGLHKLEIWEGKTGASRGGSPKWLGFSPFQIADGELIAALRNAAPELLDELDRLRDTAARLRYYHEQKETENRQLYEEVSELETKLRRECETHSAKLVEQRQELEEVHRIIRDVYSALHVDSEQISERMARDIIKHTHKGMDEALDILDRIIRVMKHSEESRK